jgi:hypothetical protein
MGTTAHLNNCKIQTCVEAALSNGGFLRLADDHVKEKSALPPSGDGDSSTQVTRV